MQEYLMKEKKDSVRQFWEEVFDEDSKAFLNYYQEWKLPENKVLAEIEGDRLVSMLHRNPYRLALGDVEAVCDYIVAVATREDRRHRGLMAGLLKRMAEDMNREGMPLCFLMPAAEAIYLPFGFTDIWDKKLFRIGSLGENFSSVEIEPEEYQALSEFAEKAIKGRAEIFALRSPAYYENLNAQLKSEGGGLYWLLRDGERAGCYSGWNDGKLYEWFWKPEFEDGLSVSPTGEAHMIMARIVSLPAFLRAVRANEDLDIRLRLTDPLVEENNGVFLWQAGPDGSVICREEEALKAASAEEGAGRPVPVLSCGIAALTAWLCGYSSLEELLGKGTIQVSREDVRLLSGVRRLHGVFLPEEV